MDECLVNLFLFLLLYLVIMEKRFFQRSDINMHASQNYSAIFFMFIDHIDRGTHSN